MSEKLHKVFDFKLPVEVTVSQGQVELNFNGFYLPSFETLELFLSSVEGESSLMIRDAENKIIKDGCYTIIVTMTDFKVAIQLDEKTGSCRYTKALIIRTLIEHFQEMERKETVYTNLLESK